MILLRIYKNLIHIYNYIYDKYMIMHNVDMIKYIYHTRGNRTVLTYNHKKSKKREEE